jgi:hypothetical protein
MLKQGDRVASQRLWEAYFGSLVGLARLSQEPSPTNIEIAAKLGCVE